MALAGVALLLSMVSAAEAGINVWTSQDIGHTDNVLVVPGTPSTLYAVDSSIDFANFHKSSDSGNTWSLVARVGFPILALAADPVTPTTLYAGTQAYDEDTSRVSKSTDAGVTWSAADSGLSGITGRVGNVYALAVDPLNTDTLYAGTDQGVFKSTDGGAAWSMANAGLPSFFRIEAVAIAIDPFTPTTLYVGYYGTNTDGASYTFGVSKSTDGAVTWTAAEAGLPDVSGNPLVIDPCTPTTLYTGASGDVFKSTDGGATWHASNTGVPGGGFVSALAVDPRTPSTVYAATFSGGVSKSTDSGVNWSPLNIGLDDPSGLDRHYFIVWALAIDPFGPSTLYAAALDLYSIQEAAVCVGNCHGAEEVAINDVITLVNIALGSAPPATCADGGLPIGGEVDISVIIDAVNNTLAGCNR